METVNQKLARLSKWKLHQFYARYPHIAPYLPPAARLSQPSLNRFLDLYRRGVYIKANRVHTGKGVIKAWKMGKGYRFVIVKGDVQHAASVKDLHSQIVRFMPNRSFLVQKAIDLATVSGRSFDIRVMMMRDGHRNWNYAGMVAKVNGTGSIVSNVRRGGGYVMTVEQALRQSLKCSTQRIESIKKTLIQLSRDIMSASESYPFFSYQCGIDLAVDKQGKVWVIEVNLHNPSHSLFNRLQDKTFFRTIRRLHRAYRRNNKRVI
ncbi:YheC/YheD family protein [Paenibacillus guangzhouensis]|uniref:YheC/YheD family protein n=1 Tax=Paenibacillus guangzhouensis TaxID=1473112 RepID=UPI00187B7B88|nr:YheC/YheD family protein [Paenibacillus guangzhouensis]